MKSFDIAERILLFNQGRQPELLRMKLERLRQDPFIFLRGTCHLFYEHWPRNSVLNDAPRVWLCGDLHLENFGSFKADNRLVHFDLNDFDEAALAPCSWDVIRLLTSVLVGADSLKIRRRDRQAACQVCLDAYLRALATGRAGWVERETSRGLVRELLESLRIRKRKQFLNGRTKLVNGKRWFREKHPRMLPVSNAERAQIEAFFKTWAAKQDNPWFFRLLDVARRIAGTGSLGVDRYVALIEGNGSPNDNFLLDMKEARPSALSPLLQELGMAQPDWSNEAARVIAVKDRMLSSLPALGDAVEFAGKPFVICELEPTQDRVSLAGCGGKLKWLRPILETMGELTAWSQLRSGGRQGSATADELISFAESDQWRQAMLTAALDFHDQVVADYEAYCAAYDRGFDKMKSLTSY